MQKTQKNLLLSFSINIRVVSGPWAKSDIFHHSFHQKYQYQKLRFLHFCVLPITKMQKTQKNVLLSFSTNIRVVSDPRAKSDNFHHSFHQNYRKLRFLHFCVLLIAKTQKRRKIYCCHFQLTFVLFLVPEQNQTFSTAHFIKKT